MFLFGLQMFFNMLTRELDFFLNRNISIKTIFKFNFLLFSSRIGFCIKCFDVSVYSWVFVLIFSWLMLMLINFFSFSFVLGHFFVAVNTFIHVRNQLCKFFFYVLLYGLQFELNFCVCFYVPTKINFPVFNFNLRISRQHILC